MFTVRSLYLLALFLLVQTTLARPLRRSNNSGQSRYSNSSKNGSNRNGSNRNGSNSQSNDIVDPALFASLTQSVTFNTVTTTQTQSGTITQICQVTLTPIVVNGLEIVRQDKTCKLQVNGNNGNNNNNNNNNGGNGNGNNTTTTTTTENSTSTSSTFTSTAFTNTATATTSAGTANAGVSVIGTTSVLNSGNGGASATVTGTTISTTAAAAATSAPPAVSVIGVNSVSNSGTAAQDNNGATGTLPVTAVTTLSDGSVSTSVTTPSAAAANAPQAASVPGRKLEVLPIGLGVFAGVSVIALIVVGLVTYERTKYRKAFRQRKLAEAGANMGYGGMAERT